jgi:hypothetical protein
MKNERQIEEAIVIYEDTIEKNKNNPLVWFDKQMIDTLRWVLEKEPKYSKGK